MNVADFTLDSAVVEAALAHLAEGAVEKIAGQLFREAEAIMAAADPLIPVAPDGGTLKASGHVQLPVVDGNEVSVTMGFGGAASAYAEAIHEHPSPASPPSWSGKEIHFSVPGTGHKFLERPFLAAVGDEMNARVMAAALGSHA